MRQAAIFNQSIQDQTKHNLIAVHQAKQSFTLFETPIFCAIINSQDIYFDAQAAKNDSNILVKKKAFSCNFRDKSLAIQAKHIIDKHAIKSKVKFYTLGSEFVGEVVAMGKAVQTLELGDLVIGNGSFPYSGYKGVNPGLPSNHASKELEVFHYSKVVKIPNSMPVDVAAGFSIGGQTSYAMIRKLGLQKGDNVLVTAATSNTSLFAINALKNKEVNVYAITSRRQFKADLHRCGVKEVFIVSPSTKELTSHPNISRFFKQNGGFDVIIDPFFDLYMPKVIPLLDFQGKYITCGFYRQHPKFEKPAKEQGINELQLIMTNVMCKNLHIIGNCIGNTLDLENAIRDYEKGHMEVIIDRVYKKGEIAAFFDRSFNAQDRFGKVIYQY